MSRILLPSVFMLFLCCCSASRNSSWTEKNQTKAEELGLTQKEVVILASLVEKETDLSDEKPRIARVYLNRLEKGMFLQSDPTVLFALGDTTIKRIQKEHLDTDSPYNTYKYKGLPPGPICEPSRETILAVVNAKDHDFLYFCLKPDFSGHFNYAKTYKDHAENVRQFQEALDQRNRR